MASLDEIKKIVGPLAEGREDEDSIIESLNSLDWTVPQTGVTEEEVNTRVADAVAETTASLRARWWANSEPAPEPEPEAGIDKQGVTTANPAPVDTAGEKSPFELTADDIDL